MKVGVFPGKFLPPHRGHINAIIQAATQVDKLYVVVSSSDHYMEKVCKEEGLRLMPNNLRAKWVAKELSGFDHIRVLEINENEIPEYPYGIKLWAKELKRIIPEPFHIIFGGEKEYQDTYMKEFPGVDYLVYDTNRLKYPISATLVRQNPIKYWDYIIGVARPHFAKRVLITGTESCGKTTLTKYLAKLYHTSWAEEYGRYYSTEEFGANENLFNEEDFYEISERQIEVDNDALRHANKVVFFDTDAVVTHFYRDIYLNKTCPFFDFPADPSKYDLVLMLGTEVRWVDDGFRFKGEQKEREELFEKLKELYIEYGFDMSKFIEIHNHSYHERLNISIKVLDNFLK